jgi:hypothetical protein
MQTTGRSIRDDNVRELPQRSNPRPRAGIARRLSRLPDSLPPRGLDREQSAEYVGVSCTKFDEMRADGRIGPPKQVDGRIVFDRHRLDKDFSHLPDAGPAGGRDENPYD